MVEVEKVVDTDRKTDPVTSEITVCIDTSAKDEDIDEDICKAVQTVKSLCAEIHNQKFYMNSAVRISYKVTVR